MSKNDLKEFDKGVQMAQKERGRIVVVIHKDGTVTTDTPTKRLAFVEPITPEERIRRLYVDLDTHLEYASKHGPDDYYRGVAAALEMVEDRLERPRGGAR